MFNAILRPGRFRRGSLALAVLVVAGGFAAVPAAAEPSQQQRTATQSADLLVQIKSHREVRRGHDRVKRPHQRRHIVKRDWRRHDRGHRAKRHHWRRHDHGYRAKRHHWRGHGRGLRAGRPNWHRPNWRRPDWHRPDWHRPDWRRHDNWNRRDWGHEALRRLFR